LERERERKNCIKSPQEDILGFGNALAGLITFLNLIGEGENAKKIFPDIKYIYSCLNKWYKRIPFDKLDKEDEDFKFFFNFKEKLIGLKMPLEKLEIALEKGEIFKDLIEYNSLQSSLKEILLLSKKYRREILAKYSLDKSKYLQK